LEAAAPAPAAALRLYLGRRDVLAEGFVDFGFAPVEDVFEGRDAVEDAFDFSGRFLVNSSATI
jgi:hypothetical protein